MYEIELILNKPGMFPSDYDDVYNHHDNIEKSFNRILEAIRLFTVANS